MMLVLLQLLLRQRVTMIARFDGNRSRWGWLGLPAVLLIVGISLSSAQTQPTEHSSTAPSPPTIDPSVQTFLDTRVPDFSITGNLTLSTMDITNVQSPVGIANMTTNIATG